MTATTPNRLYPYPIDTDPIDTAGHTQRLAEAIDLDMAQVNTQHSAQQSELDGINLDLANLYAARYAVNTPWGQSFDGPAFEMSHQWIVTDGNGNGFGAFKAGFTLIPTVIFQSTMEGSGHFYKVTPFENNMTTGGFAFNFSDWSGASIPNSGAHFSIYACAKWL